MEDLHTHRPERTRHPPPPRAARPAGSRAVPPARPERLSHLAQRERGTLIFASAILLAITVYAILFCTMDCVFPFCP